MQDETKTTIFADECGYTGRALYDKEQPIFVLATMRITELQAKRIKNKFFNGYHGPELKHVKIASRPRGRTMILEYLRWLSDNQHLLGYAYIHKEFALVAKMVDLIIEPSFYLACLDLYERGANIALANITYYIVKSLASPDYLRKLLRTFYDLTQKPDPEHLRHYEDVLDEYHEPEPLNTVLEYYRKAIHHLGPHIFSVFNPSCLDMMQSYALTVMAHWSKRGAAPFRLIQDQSSEMAQGKVLWDAVTDPNATSKLVGRDRRTIQYPIGIESTLLAQSHDWAGLQLTDIIAGAITRMLKSYQRNETNHDEYAADIYQVIRTWTCSEHLWPTLAVTPSELGTEGPAYENPIEHIEKIKRELDES